MVINELQWLKDHPEFRERPPTLTEFLGPKYLNCIDQIRPRLLKELEMIIGNEVRTDKPTLVTHALVTGGIGIGKTTAASIVHPYLVCWMLCLKDPQKFFRLLPGSRIAFMQMSTTEINARQVIFQDIKARIENSPWFKNLYTTLPDFPKEFKGNPYDPNFKNQLRFPHEIWVLPGDSLDTTFEGYNIFGGILDEADSHKITDDKDYAAAGWDTINNRMSSRFQNRGFLMVIGQKKSSVGFIQNKMDELSGLEYPEAYVVSLAIWESYGLTDQIYADPKTGEFKTFCYDPKRKTIVPSGVQAMLGDENILTIPVLYLPNFKANPDKALKDLAGMPQLVGDAFISLYTKIEACRDRWVARNPNLKSPYTPDGKLERWFVANNSLPRACHIDLAYSGEGDACGFAMGHVREVVEIDGEYKPYIIIDLLVRIKARPGSQIMIQTVRQFLYHLADDLRFKIDHVTMDGFESTDSIQQFKRRRYRAEYLSIDKDLLPYHDLREAIYEDRIEWPPYIVIIEKRSGNKEEEILIKELSLLVDTGKKIDHPTGGSKDVADAVAGVTSTLMGNRSYSRKRLDLSSAPVQQSIPAAGGADIHQHPALRSSSEIHVPYVPSMTQRI